MRGLHEGPLLPTDADAHRIVSMTSHISIETHVCVLFYAYLPANKLKFESDTSSIQILSNAPYFQCGTVYQLLTPPAYRPRIHDTGEN